MSAAPPGVKVVERAVRAGARGYVATTVRGLRVTLRHFVRNMFLGRRDVQTIAYPEEQRAYPPRFRGQHRLMLRDDGSLRCVACMLCPTICPAHCITVIAEEGDNSDEKRARVFEIDELRCVVCGLCVEACPVDAIRMDTGIHVAPSRTRAAAVLDAFALRARGTRSTTLDSPGVGVGWRASWDQRSRR